MHLKSAELNKIAAFIAAFFIARLIGRVPFGETLICPNAVTFGAIPDCPRRPRKVGVGLSLTRMMPVTAHHGSRTTAQGPGRAFRWLDWVDDG